MQRSILWTGKEHHSLENCDVHDTESGAEVKSVVIGTYERKSFRLDYFIKVNTSWETLFFELRIQLGKWKQTLRFEGDACGNWYKEGEAVPDFKGCIDIDISVSPLTNSMPIKRLQLSPGQSTEIKVLYLDILHHTMSPVDQRYTRLSESSYKYENVPRDFEATIEVDESGLVTDYPPLFVRKQLQDNATP